jgi:hypothetical protein
VGGPQRAGVGGGLGDEGGQRGVLRDGERDIGAAAAAAEASVQRAQAALATAEERLRRAQDVQMRFRELQASGTRAA